MPGQNGRSPSSRESRSSGVSSSSSPAAAASTGCPARTAATAAEKGSEVVDMAHHFLHTTSLFPLYLALSPPGDTRHTARRESRTRQPRVVRNSSDDVVVEVLQPAFSVILTV